MAAAITFEPDAETVVRVCRQLTSLSDLSAVYDNSTTDSARDMVDRICAEFSVPVLRGRGNRGTAGGINALTRRAVAGEAEWLTYFDQDTVVPDGFHTTLTDLEEQGPDVAAVGSRLEDQPPIHPRWVPSRYLIASGTSWRVAALVEVDGCDEDMVIDVVEHEVCLRLRLRGWRLVTDQRRMIRHPIGDGAVTFYKILLSRHPLWRRERMWRNTIVLARRYARICPFDVARLLAGRTVETAVGVLSGRGRGWAGAARRGVAEGMRAPAGSRRGLRNPVE